MFRFVGLVLLLLGQSFAQAQNLPRPKQFSDAELKASNEWNLKQQRSLKFKRDLQDRKPYRPVTDTDNFYYLLMNGSFFYNSNEIKEKIAENLPAHMKLVLLVYPGEEKQVRDQFKKWIDSDRIIIASHENSTQGFWARDAFPFPVYANTKLETRLVGAKYIREFRAHEVIANAVGAQKLLTKNDFFFVGGNMLADESGDCFIVEGPRSFSLTDEMLRSAYGCVDVHRFPHVSGIGDVDEVIKILPGKRVLTNQKSYVSRLRDLGYQVTMLPELSHLRTYANSLIVGQTVIMPSYGVDSDEDAKEVYERFGYRVVMADSNNISTVGMGSIHCITMAYPKIDLDVLMRHLNARIVH